MLIFVCVLLSSDSTTGSRDQGVSRVPSCNDFQWELCLQWYLSSSFDKCGFPLIWDIMFHLLPLVESYLLILKEQKFERRVSTRRLGGLTIVNSVNESIEFFVS
jgi:hypothetical protein